RSGGVTRLGPSVELDRTERFEQSLDRDVALLDGLRRHDLQDGPEALLADPAGDGHRLRTELAHDDVLAGGAANRDLAGQALEEDEPPRVEVGTRRRRLAAELLGRGVARGPRDLVARAGSDRRSVHLREASEAEVQHQGVSPDAGLRHHDVLGLEVAV